MTALPDLPGFSLSPPGPCPYLPGKMSREVFTIVDLEAFKPYLSALSKRGFRRSRNVLYRPACPSCNSCVSVRIKVDQFRLSKSHRRILSKNASAARQVTLAMATKQQQIMFQKYVTDRHSSGGMAEMDDFEFCQMVEDSPPESRVVQYSDPLPDSSRRKLIAACITDFIDDGLSMVYSFYDTSLSGRSLGKFMILDHVAYARELGLPHLYLGYWVKDCRKMSYKAEFSGLEGYLDGAWGELPGRG